MNKKSVFAFLVLLFFLFGCASQNTQAPPAEPPGPDLTPAGSGVSPQDDIDRLASEITVPLQELDGLDESQADIDELESLVNESTQDSALESIQNLDGVEENQFE